MDRCAHSWRWRFRALQLWCLCAPRRCSCRAHAPAAPPRRARRAARCHRRAPAAPSRALAVRARQRRRRARAAHARRARAAPRAAAFAPPCLLLLALPRALPLRTHAPRRALPPVCRSPRARAARCLLPLRRQSLPLRRLSLPLRAPSAAARVRCAKCCRRCSLFCSRLAVHGVFHDKSLTFLSTFLSQPLAEAAAVARLSVPGFRAARVLALLGVCAEVHLGAVAVLELPAVALDAHARHHSARQAGRAGSAPLGAAAAAAAAAPHSDGKRRSASCSCSARLWKGSPACAGRGLTRLTRGGLKLCGSGPAPGRRPLLPFAHLRLHRKEWRR
jgi:hypothetical protein